MASHLTEAANLIKCEERLFQPPERTLSLKDLCERMRTLGQSWNGAGFRACDRDREASGSDDDPRIDAAGNGVRVSIGRSRAIAFAG